MTEHDPIINDLARSMAAGQPADLDAVHRAALERLRKRAAEAGLLDVAYGLTDSPLGALAVFVTPLGLVRVAYEREGFDVVLSEVAKQISPRILEAAERTDPVRRQLDDYFERRLRRFVLPIDWMLVRGFGVGVLRATAAIPYGTLSTYREVAAQAGSPNAYRAAGNALGHNPIPIVVPCHRVVHSTGGLGGYTGGLDRKEFLLRLEGSLPGGGA
jgi:methylated-DNA-[protein]-cysteine S-methyltransferase